MQMLQSFFYFIKFFEQEFNNLYVHTKFFFYFIIFFKQEFKNLYVHMQLQELYQPLD